MLSLNQATHSPEDKQLIKEIWLMVEKNLDLELDLLERERVEKEMR